jgi:hypothetical protein
VVEGPVDDAHRAFVDGEDLEPVGDVVTDLVVLLDLPLDRAGEPGRQDGLIRLRGDAGRLGGESGGLRGPGQPRRLGVV